jgi:GxxExxY protein
MAFEREVSIPLVYRDEIIPMCYKVDFIVEGKVLLELKALDAVPSIADAQVLTYLKLTRIPTALLVNFNSVPLHKGIRRFVNAHANPSEVSEVSAAT